MRHINNIINKVLGKFTISKENREFCGGGTLCDICPGKVGCPFKGKL